MGLLPIGNEPFFFFGEMGLAIAPPDLVRARNCHLPPTSLYLRDKDCVIWNKVAEFSVMLFEVGEC